MPVIYYAVLSAEDNTWVACHRHIESRDPNRIVLELQDRHPGKWIINARFVGVSGAPVFFDTTIAENFISRMDLSPYTQL